MPKILVLIDWYLPGYKAGGPITSVSNFIRVFKGDCSFSIITRNTDYCDTIPYEGINNDTWVLGSDKVRVYYFSKANLNLLSLINLIKNEEFDYLYLNSIYSKYFAIIPLLFSSTLKNKIVVAPRGMLAEGAIKVKGYKKRLFIIIAKYLNLFKGVTFQASSEYEKRQILKYFGNNSKVLIAPNLPKPIQNNIIEDKKLVKIKGEVVFSSVARISPEKNLLFALNLLNNLKGKIIFNIYGSIYDLKYWNKCKKLIDKFKGNIQVKYHDSIRPELLEKVLNDSDFLLFPTTGENFGHIIWESLSVGTPVIISDQTPWRHLQDDSVGWDIPLMKRDKFVEILNNCIQMDKEEYRIMSESAINYCLEYINKSDSVKMNRALFSIS